MNKRAQALGIFRWPGQQGWLGLLMVLTMSSLTAVAANLPPPQFEPVGARLLAMAIPLTLSALGIVLLVRDLRQGGNEAEDEASGLGAHVLLRPGALYGVLVTYTYLVSLGLQNWLYVCISGAFAGLIAALIQTPVRPVIIALAAIVGTLLSAGIAWSFANFLYVDIAR